MLTNFMNRLRGKEKAVAISGAGVQEASVQVAQSVEQPPDQVKVVVPIFTLLKSRKWVRDIALNRTGILDKFIDNQTAEMHYVDPQTGLTIWVAPVPLANLRIARIVEIPACRHAFQYREDGTVDTNATIDRMNQLGYF